MHLRIPMPSAPSTLRSLALFVLVACGEGQDPAPSASGGASGTGGTVPVAGAGAGGAAGGSGALGGSSGAGVAGAGGNGGSGGVGAAAGAGAGGAGGVAANAGASGGGAGGAAAGSAGDGSAGDGGGSGSSGASGMASGGAGAGGSDGGASGGSVPVGGTAGAGGSSGAGGRPSRCPAGPFPAPMASGSTNVCQNFTFDYTWNEGPTWVAAQRAFFFTNFVAGSGSGGNIIKYTPGGNCEVFIRDVGCNGLAVSNDGNLLAACQQTRAIIRFDLATKQATTVANMAMGTVLDTPNDLVQHSNGSIYFSNPPNELDGRPGGVGAAAFRVDPMGNVSLIQTGNSNGVGLSPDERTLYILLRGMWDLDAQGVPSNRQNMFTTGDGMGVDCAGNVYANGGIFSPEGNRLGDYGSGTNLAFGGDDGKTALVTGSGRALRTFTSAIPGLP
jgi:sugar lactone lactonase YvrE